MGVVMAISRRPCERRLVRAPRWAAGATPMRRWQDLGTKGRRRLERQRSRAGWNIRFPLGGDGVSVALDRKIPWRCQPRLHADDLWAGGRVGHAPRLPRAVGEGTRREPATGVVWGTELSPARQPSPTEAVTGRTRLAPADVGGGVCPPPPDGVQGRDEGLRRGPRRVVTQGRDRGCEGLAAGLAGSHRPRGPLAVAPCRCPPGLAQAGHALREGRDARLRRRPPSPARGETGGDPWPEGVFDDLSRLDGDQTVVRPSPVVPLGDPSVPATPRPDGVQAVQHPMAAHR